VAGECCFEGLRSGGRSGGFKVCVCGAAGSVDQQLALLLAMEPRVWELSVFDLDAAAVPVRGVAEDISHLATRCKVKPFTLSLSQRPAAELPAECLSGCSLVFIQAGVPRKAGQEKSDFLNKNLNIAKMLVEACAKFCPLATVGLMVNPISSVVPAMAALYEKEKLDPCRIIGVTSLSAARASKFVHEATGVPAEQINVPVVGGHTGRSVLPLFSQDPAGSTLSLEARRKLDLRVQEGDEEVIKAKRGRGGAALSAAHAAMLLARAVLNGLAGQRGSMCVFIKSEATELPYLTSPVNFGRRGAEQVKRLPRLDDNYESERLFEVTQLLQEDIEAGLKYAQTNRLNF